ncbi:alkaline phosphatase D family protein [Myxococcus qinghaiensis]|uniref:alkaline phosphatase D family protein n=1 Tax=Myxococcus qinghaiensis TaxID=2906758 RepID=UPI0020A7945B|nr:alkaline phosphatase D family protein [Myxococcus qinghaiensis]
MTVLTRRTVLQGLAITAAGCASTRPIRAPRPGPSLPLGAQLGDVRTGAVTVWGKADRASRLVVEWSEDSRLVKGVHRVEGAALTEASDYTGVVDLTGLPAGREVFVRVLAEDGGVTGEEWRGRFLTSPDSARDVCFAWSADVCGQGWGINPEWGGYRGFAAVHALRPDFFLHVGDAIYADNPLLPEVVLPDGRVWRNRVTPAKSKVAETLEELRGNFAYNFLDDSLRALAKDVPIAYQWDDHEVRNNWYPGRSLAGDPRYTRVADEAVLGARARQAFFEYSPVGGAARAEGRIHRQLSQGPLLDVFIPDVRAFRAPNSINRQEQQGPETAFLGRAQLDGLKQALAASRATWKVIATSMPLGLIIPAEKLPDGAHIMEAWANGPGAPLGRELELAELLSFLKERKVRNVVFVTADVHYPAMHHYHPDRARFRDFDPFWEFVAGPLNAGTFGPSPLDETFGPEVKWHRPATVMNAAPWEGQQYFGSVRIQGASGVMTVAIHDLTGKALHSVELEPNR